MKTGHARRIRVGLRMARYEASVGWRILFDVDDTLVDRALQRERARLRLPSRHRALAMPIDWKGWTR